MLPIRRIFTITIYSYAIATTLTATAQAVMYNYWNVLLKRSLKAKILVYSA